MAETIVNKPSVDDEYGFPIGLGINAAQYQELKQQYGLMNFRIDKLETKIESTIAVVAKSSSNSGSQFLSGDVGLVSVLGVTVLLCVAIVGWTQYQIQKLRKQINN